MSHALALVADDETTRLDDLSLGIKVRAVLTVTADNQRKIVSFSSDNPQVQIVDGNNIKLQPDSSAHQPTLYELLFVASTGIASFRSPAAEIWLDGAMVAYSVNPSGDGLSFAMSFRNNLPPKAPGAQYSFTVLWNGSDGPLEAESEDPTIFLDPPNS
jgi:hypothetical protein